MREFVMKARPVRVRVRVGVWVRVRVGVRVWVRVRVRVRTAPYTFIYAPWRYLPWLYTSILTMMRFVMKDRAEAVSDWLEGDEEAMVVAERKVRYLVITPRGRRGGHGGGRAQGDQPEP